ncbi:TIGR02117 family protein [Sphingomonas sp. LY54]|uniref:TIGR02117 family protein n=1 Tax=Sphingomonas sp. LY54 TaxID=3095343 RepID=UPI002D772C8C|nr:TIGR02117 family protein [Sphingomonas sp. LY54]WRP27906.1 TIGR02117 family protein [Sphingomonas sp. LY54]
MKPRTIARIAAFALAGLLAPVLLYLAAALIGGLIPVNRDWKAPEAGIPIFIETNGVHTWVMVPTVSADMDWRPLAPAEHLKDPRYAGNYIAIGFGNRDFYLNTPTWGDLSPRTAAAALVGGGPSLMHVYHSRDPQPGPYQQRILLTPDQYRRLVGFLAGSFQLRDGRTMPLLGRGYGASDVFYESRVPYNFSRTCNEWTGEALRAAGVRMGAWTPLAQSITWRLD